MDANWSVGPKALLCFGLLATSIFIAGCNREGAKSNSSTGPSESKPKKKEGSSEKGPDGDLSKATPHFSITAKEFCDEFKRDGKAAHAKFSDKIIDLSGIVGSYIYRSAAKIPFVILVTEKKEDGATCFTVVQDPWSKVLPGQKVKIRGKHLENAGGYPSLFECVFIEVGASPGIVITAEELAKEFAANREATNKKYADKFVIVSGLISEKTKDNDSFMYVLLKGTDKVRVKGGFETDLADLLKVGENVRIVGAYSKFSTGEEINLSVAFPLKGP